MGRDLAREFPAAEQTFAEADEVLGVPLSRWAWEGPEESLVATENAQPAILTHSVAVLRVVSDRLDEVGFAAGHSLGEFSAYVAAGALDFADALRVVRRRGELMQRSGEERPGTMAAIIGLDDDAVIELCREAEADGGDCVPANFNSNGQVVISGDRPTVKRAVALARERGARRAIPLNVSGAFHSPLMASAEAGLQVALDGVELRKPEFAVISNVTAEPVLETSRIRRTLIEQLTAPVQWAAGVQEMRRRGVQRFLELGPGRVLTGLTRRIDRDASCTPLGNVEAAREFLSE